jgi:hypothetical protein
VPLLEAVDNRRAETSVDPVLVEQLGACRNKASRTVVFDIVGVRRSTV